MSVHPDYCACVVCVGRATPRTCRRCGYTGPRGEFRTGTARPGTGHLSDYCKPCRQERVALGLAPPGTRTKPKRALGEGSGVDVWQEEQDKLFPGRSYHSLTRPEHRAVRDAAVARLVAAGCRAFTAPGGNGRHRDQETAA